MKFSDITFFDNPTVDIVCYTCLIYVGKLRSMKESLYNSIKDFTVFSLSISKDKIYLTLDGNLKEEE